MFQCLGHPIPSHSNRFEQIRTSCSYLFIISLPYDFDGSKIRKIDENCDNWKKHVFTAKKNRQKPYPIGRQIGPHSPEITRNHQNAEVLHDL